MERQTAQTLIKLLLKDDELGRATQQTMRVICVNDP